MRYVIYGRSLSNAPYISLLRIYLQNTIRKLPPLKLATPFSPWYGSLPADLCDVYMRRSRTNGDVCPSA